MASGSETTYAYDYIGNLHLDIPEAFTNQFTTIHDSARLYSRKGAWQVEIKLKPGRSQKKEFAEGWNVFVRQHGLELGDFVVFEHLGWWDFQVVIFERSACEKLSYPICEP
ncbi:hypothetical protein RJ639_046830 [Escallonia herrerae]|uniref:TF-B3 domain-containing protein n=1 Tax=Escallonia herrerae TaxID=1293975 RepID=A0AA89B1E9_9ASTE|nr:hypothetical protein RJ639_046830 [Escallonia herrerae]